METIADIRQLPDLGEETVHIWGVHVPNVLDRLEALYGLLSKKEREKAARFHREPDRQSSIVARGALRVLLSCYTGTPAIEIGFEYSRNGKPHLEPYGAGFQPAQGRQGCPPHDEIAFNVSHSADWVVLAFGRNRNIGVDVERIKREMDVLSIASRYFAPEETARIENTEDRHALFFQLWAHKEAYVKACGSTLFTELGDFPAPVEERGEKAGWIFHRLEVGSEYAAAVVTDKKLASVPCYDFGGLKWES